MKMARRKDWRCLNNLDRPMKPFWHGNLYGIIDPLPGSMTIAYNRPWYRGWYFINGMNTAYLDDPEGRYVGPAVYARPKIIGRNVR